MDAEPVGIGQIRVARPPSRLVIHGLGSCVAVFLYEVRGTVGALAHCMLPVPPDPERMGEPGRYVALSVDRMLTELAHQRVDVRAVGAKLVGGASMFQGARDDGRPGIGERNVAVARAALAEHGVPIHAEDVGGEHGRTVRAELATGRLTITSLRRPPIEL